MSPEGWATNLGALLAALYAGWQANQAKRYSGKANESSELAAERSEPTSNGFAKGVIERLSRIERKTDQTAEMVSAHINDHARAGLYRKG